MSFRTSSYSTFHHSRLAAFLRRLALVVMSLAFGVTLDAAADPARPDETRRDFNIPADEIFAALKQFTAQSNEQLIYRVDSLEGVRTSAIRGHYTSREALTRMLGQTHLIVTRDERTGTLAIRPGNDTRPPPPPPSAAAKKKSPTP